MISKLTRANSKKHGAILPAYLGLTALGIDQLAFRHAAIDSRQELFAGLLIYGSIVVLTSELIRSRSPFVRHLTLNVVIASVVTTLITRGFNASGFGVTEAMLTVRAHHYATDAVTAFLPLWLLPSVIGLVFGAILYVIANHLAASDRHDRETIATAFALVVFLALPFTGAGSWVIPAPWKVPVAFATAPMIDDPSLSSLKAQPVEDPPGYSIVFIVDESIRGDHLSLHGYSRDTTPFLSSIAPSLAQARTIVSSSNCSQASNFILRNGLQPSQLPVEKHSRDLDLFGHARMAGMRTVWIDAQHVRPPVTLSDALDRFVGVDELVGGGARNHLIDMAALDFIEREISRGPALILVNKRGAHFRYERSHPAHQTPFRPAVREYLPYMSKERVRNSYDNALRWTVDEFFRRLWRTIEDHDVIVAYTADHGQTVERPGVYPQCVRVDPPPEQAIVPFIAIGFGNGRAVAERVFGDPVSSHFDLFPLLLETMGRSCSREPGRSVAAFWSGDVWGLSPGEWNRVTIPASPARQ